VQSGFPYCSPLCWWEPGFYRRKKPALIDLLTLIALIAISIALSIPSVARLPRASYHQKDQFEWAEILEHGNGEKRQEAITALCTILKDRRNQERGCVFLVSVSALGVGKAKEALPTLNDLLRNLDDPFCKGQIKNAIGMIESNE
jgi:hypothetical protein